MARFKKAEVLISQGEYTDALSELTTLIEVAPKEGSVYFTLGKARALSLRTHRPPALRARARPRDGPPKSGGVWLWPPPTTAS